MKILYLEPDEEITSVIDRIRGIDDPEIAIVVPRRAGLLQSIINLKLLRFQSEQMKKRLSIVTTDKSGRNLASAVGLTVYQKVPEGADASEAEVAEPTPKAVIPVSLKPSAKAATPKPKKVIPDQPSIRKRIIAEDPTPEEEEVPVTPEPETEPATPLEPEPEPVVAPAEPEPVKSQLKEPPPPPETKPTKPRGATAASIGKALKSKLPSKPVLSRPNLKLPRFKLPRKLPPAGIAAALILVLLLAFTIPTFALAKANVTVTVPTETLKADIPAVFSSRTSSVDSASNIVPAKTIEIDKSTTVELPATGQPQATDRATGTITISNRLAAPQGLVARTRFQSSDGKVYRIQSGVTVPGGGSVKATVVADAAGEEGNLPAGTLLTLVAIANSAVTAQSDAITAAAPGTGTAVSAADVDKARIALAQKAAAEGVTDARGKLAVGFKLDEKAVNTDVTGGNPTPPTGTEAAKFTFSGTVRVTYFTYEEPVLQKVIAEDLQSKVPEGSSLADMAPQLTFASTESSTDSLTGTFRVTAATAPALSSERIAEDIAGKTPEEAKRTLEESGRAINATIDLSPFWIRHVPKSAKKINIRYAPAGGGPTVSPKPSPSQSPPPSAQPQATGTPAPTGTDAPLL